MTAPKEYRDRYCAFVDILGFSELVNGLSRNPESFIEVRRLLSMVYKKPTGRYSRRFDGSKFHVQNISDALCISTECNEPGLAHMFFSLTGLAQSLLVQGFFVRGAIVRGPLYHDERMVFGEALVHAYKLEQEIVRFPRIMVAKRVAYEFQASEIGNSDPQAIIQSSDGPFYLHYLRNAVLLARKDLSQKARETIEERLNMMGGLIQTRFNEAVDNPRHFEKIQWFGRYWNDTVRPYGNIVRIVGPGVEPEPAVWG